MVLALQLPHSPSRLLRQEKHWLENVPVSAAAASMSCLPLLELGQFLSEQVRLVSHRCVALAAHPRCDVAAAPALHGAGAASEISSAHSGIGPSSDRNAAIRSAAGSGQPRWLARIPFQV